MYYAPLKGLKNTGFYEMASFDHILNHYATLETSEINNSLPYFYIRTLEKTNIWRTLGALKVPIRLAEKPFLNFVFDNIGK